VDRGGSGFFSSVHSGTGRGQRTVPSMLLSLSSFLAVLHQGKAPSFGFLLCIEWLISLLSRCTWRVLSNLCGPWDIGIRITFFFFCFDSARRSFPPTDGTGRWFSFLIRRYTEFFFGGRVLTPTASSPSLYECHLFFILIILDFPSLPDKSAFCDKSLGQPPRTFFS